MIGTSRAGEDVTAIEKFHTCLLVPRPISSVRSGRVTTPPGKCNPVKGAGRSRLLPSGDIGIHSSAECRTGNGI